jgi:Cyclic nucleotide-binding domain
MLSGVVEVVDRSSDEPRTLALHQPDEFTGGVGLLQHWRPVAGAVARADTELLHIPSADLHHIIVVRSILGDKILKAFTARWNLLVESGFLGLRVAGSERSRQALRIRQFLAQPDAVHLDQRGSRAGGRRAAPAFGPRRGRHASGGVRRPPLLRNPSIRARRQSGSNARWGNTSTIWSWSGPDQRVWRPRSTAHPSA